MHLDRFQGSAKDFRIFLIPLGVCLIGCVLISNANAQQEGMGMSDSVSIQVIHAKNSTQGVASVGTGTVNSTFNNTNTETSQTQQGPQSSSSPENIESYSHLKNSYDIIVSNSDNTFTLQTEHHLYKPNDQVKAQGSIWRGMISALGGVNSVSIVVTDSNGNIVYSDKERVNSDGTYVIDFKMPPNVQNGQYTIVVRADVNSDVISALPLKMQAGIGSTEKFVVENQVIHKIKLDGNDFPIIISTNSIVTDVKFDQSTKKISFIVQGDTGTKGVADVTIPKSLLSGDFNIMVDAQAIPQSDIIVTSDTQNETTLEINYHHSSHEIDIVGTNAVPEFSLPSIVATIAITSIILVTLNNKLFRK